MENTARISWLGIIYRWGLKGGIAILDQGILSGSNFLLNVLLARWLTAADYGAFSVAFVIYLFFTSFYNALILEPMSVLGPSLYMDRIGEYISGQFRLHMILTGGLGILLVSAGMILVHTSSSNGPLGIAVTGAGIALPFMLLIWLVRRIFYIFQQPGGALFCSIIYSAVLLGGIFVLRGGNIRTGLSTWFGLLGLASLIGALLPSFWMKSCLSLPKPGDISWWDIFKMQWNFGKWLVMAAFLYTIGSQIQVFVTAGLIDLESAGIWRAMQNFALPMVQGVTAIATLGLPILAAEFGRNDFPELRRKGLRITFILTVFAVLYELTLLFFAAPLEGLLYGGKYASYVWLIPLVGLVPVLVAVESGFSLIVRALQKPVYHAVYTAAMAITGVTLGPFFVLRWGLAGAAASQLAVSLASLCVTVYLYRAWFPAVQIEKV